MTDRGKDEMAPEASEGLASFEAEVARVARRDLASWRSSTLMLAIAAFSVYLGWSFRGELRYFFSEKAPIALSEDGRYLPERARLNRFVQIEGLPSPAKVQYKQLGKSYKVFLILGTRVFVRAELLPDAVGNSEGWVTYHGKGRLLDLREEAEFVNIRNWYEEHAGFDFSRPAWILLDEVEPGRQWQYPLVAVVLGLVALLNLGLLLRRVLRARG